MGPDGITSMVLNICEHLDRKCINFDYLAYRDQVEFADTRAERLGGMKYVAGNEEAKNKFMKFWFKFVRVYRVMKEAKPDIFHINASTPYDTLVAIAAKVAGVKKVVVHSHNANNSDKSKSKIIVNKLSKCLMGLYTDAYFTCSSEAAEYMFPRKISSKKNYIYVKNGIVVDKFRFDETVRRQVRKEYGLESAFVIGNVGRLSKQKNHIFLLDVFYEVLQSEPSAILVLIGIGEERNRLENKARALGINQQVLFLGASERVNVLLQMMDVFVMTSFHEGLPVVGIEAQATGLPCIFADTITREVRITENVEFISLEKTAVEWSDMIINLSERNNDRNNGIECVCKAGFDIENISSEIAKTYIKMNISQ